MRSLQGSFPRRIGKPLHADRLFERSEEEQINTEFVGTFDFSVSFPAILLSSDWIVSVKRLPIVRPELAAFGVFQSFVNVDDLEIVVTSGVGLQNVTEHLLDMLPQRLKPLTKLNLECRPCEVSEQEADKILANLRVILPNIESLRLDLLPSLQREVALHLLQLCHSLFSLDIVVPGFDCLVPFLESVPCLRLNELRCQSLSPWTSEQAHAFGQKIRENFSLRQLCFSFGSAEANGIVVAAAVDTPSILLVWCWPAIKCSPELMEKLQTHHGLHPRDLYVTVDEDQSVWRDLFVQFPSHFAVPRLSLGDKDFFRTVEALLRDPACTARTLNTSVSGLTQESLVSLFQAISNCSSLSRVSLHDLADPWVQPLIAMFDAAIYLKDFVWAMRSQDDAVAGVIEVQKATANGLAESIARNEVLEFVEIDICYEHVCPLLVPAVRVRNVAICVRRCRMLFLSWILGGHCNDCVLFDVAVVYDVLVSAELDWAETQRSASEASGLAMVALEMAKPEYN